MENQGSAFIIATHILNHDRYGQWLGLVIEECREGFCKVSLAVRDEMLNGLGIVHGGIIFSLADSAFAFASNSRNERSIAMDTSINFLKPAHIGDRLIASALELHNGQSSGLYEVSVHNQKNELVARFKGLCFRTNQKIV